MCTVVCTLVRLGSGKQRPEGPRQPPRCAAATEEGSMEVSATLHLYRRHWSREDGPGGRWHCAKARGSPGVGGVLGRRSLSGSHAAKASSCLSPK